MSLGKPQKTTARRPSDEGTVRPVITSNGAAFLQVRSVGSHNKSGREEEGNKEGIQSGIRDVEEYSRVMDTRSILSLGDFSLKRIFLRGP